MKALLEKVDKPKTWLGNYEEGKPHGYYSIGLIFWLSYKRHKGKAFLHNCKYYIKEADFLLNSYKLVPPIKWE